MHNGIGATPAAPIDMLLGLLGQRSAQGASKSDEFGRLLGMFGPAAGGTLGGVNGLPVPGSPFAAKPEMASAESIQLILPQDLAQALGLNAQPVPETNGQIANTNNPEPMAMVKAELLSTDDGKNQSLYLKIPTGDTPEMAALMPEGNESAEDMVLPMRLRTVEQQGGRIIADAELQTAAGKDNTIRLRLELAGNPKQIQDMVDNSAGKNSHGANSAKNGQSLPHLLNNLDVQSMVIEQIGDKAEAGARAIMPRNITGIKMSSSTPAAANSSTGIFGTDTDTNGLPKIAIEGDRSESSGFDMGRNDSGRTMFGNGTAANTTGIAGETGVNGTTTIPASEIGNVASRSDINTESDQIRFYNIDQKIDQLKQSPGQRINIQLVPARLGKMELSIASHRGLVTVKLSLDSVQAKQAVERNLSQLESHLSSSGIRVDNFQLQVNQSAKNASYSAYQQQYDRQQDGFAGNQGRGSRQNPYQQQQSRQFGLSDGGFEQSLVNCLA